MLSAARALAGEYETKVSGCLARGPLPHAGQDSPGKPGAPRTIATAATDKPSSHNTSGVRPLNVGTVPQAEARYQAAQARYAQAAEALTSEILSWLAAAIRAVFPDAAWVETHGLYSEDQEQKLQALRLFGSAGTPLADAEALATPTDRAFAALAQRLSPGLDQLAYLNGVDYLGTGRIDLT